MAFNAAVPLEEESPFVRGLAALPVELHALVTSRGIQAALAPLPTDQRRRLCVRYGDPPHAYYTRNAENRGNTPCSDPSYQLLNHARGQIMNVTPLWYQDKGYPYYQNNIYNQGSIVIGYRRMDARTASMFEICGCRLDIVYRDNKNDQGWNDEVLRKAKELQVEHLKYWQAHYKATPPFTGTPEESHNMCEEWHNMLSCACETNNSNIVKFLMHQFVEKFQGTSVVMHAERGKLLELDLLYSPGEFRHIDYFYRAIDFLEGDLFLEGDCYEIFEFLDEVLNLPWPWSWQRPRTVFPVNMLNASRNLMRILYRTRDPRTFELLFRSFLLSNAENAGDDVKSKKITVARFLLVFTKDDEDEEKTEQFRNIIRNSAREILEVVVRHDPPLNEDQLDSYEWHNLDIGDFV